MRALARAAAVLLVLHALAIADEDTDADDGLIAWKIRHSRLYLDAGWPEGITYELGRRQDIPEPLGMLPPFEEVVLSGRIAFRLDLDAAGFVAPRSLGDFESGVIVRRARVETSGQFLFGVTTDYDFEMSIEGESVFLNQSYLAWNPNRFGVATITLGHTTPPMGLENMESSRTYVFMEMGSPGQALAPGYRSGLILNGAHVPWRLAWAAGFFSAGQTQATGDASKALAQGIGRLAWYGGDPGGANLLHLGLSMSALVTREGDIQYRSRPESFKAPFVVDTNTIDSRSATQYGLEAAWSHGPQLVQAELLQSFVTDVARSQGVFWGSYLFASWLLTGEHRSYLPGTGVFARATPHRSFHVHEPGRGAFEVAARLSYLDLSSGRVRGGKMLDGTAGLNWYPNPEIRLMVNYIVTSVTDGPDHGVGNIFQARIEMGL